MTGQKPLRCVAKSSPSFGIAPRDSATAGAATRLTMRRREAMTSWYAVENVVKYRRGSNSTRGDDQSSDGNAKNLAAFVPSRRKSYSVPLEMRFLADRQAVRLPKNSPRWPPIRKVGRFWPNERAMASRPRWCRCFSVPLTTDGMECVLEEIALQLFRPVTRTVRQPAVEHLLDFKHCRAKIALPTMIRSGAGVRYWGSNAVRYSMPRDSRTWKRF